MMIAAAGSDSRRKAACLAALGLAAASLLVPGSAMAASMQDCGSQLEALDGAFPNGIQDTWVEILREKLDAINALTDSTAVAEGMQQVIMDYEAYQRDPDPDGDGLAFAPEVVEAESNLMMCLHSARMKEVGDPAELEQAADESSPAEEEEAVEEEPEVTIAEPIGGPGEWFAALDYPVAALREERQGVVEYEVTVGHKGEVVGCEASGGPGNSDLEVATCDALLANARFKPSTDAAGKTYVTRFSGRLRWTLP